MAVWYNLDKMFERNDIMVLEKIECAKFTVDKFFDVRYGSEKYFEYIGREAYRALPKLLYSDDVERFNVFFESVKEQWKGIAVKIKRADDVYRDAYIRARKKSKLVGGVQLWDMELYDVEALTQAYAANRSEVKKYRTLLGMMDVAFFCYEHGQEGLSLNRIVNGQEKVLYSMKLEEWKRVIDTGHIDKADEDIFAKLCADVERGVPEFSAELSADLYSDDGEIKPCLITGSTITREGVPVMTVGIVKRLTPQDSTAPDRDNYLDPLTRLYNKAYIQNMAKQAVGNRNGSHSAIFIMDIDNFKEINDSFGHMYGDEVLSRVAGVVLDVLADNGVAGRIGGDEFMGIIYNVKDKEMVRHILRSIRSSVEYLYSDVAGVNVTCSIGAARCPEDGDSYDELFNCADKCLYIAKEKGKNRYIIYQEELHGTIRIADRQQTKIENNSANVNDNISMVVKDAIGRLYADGSTAIPEVLEMIAKAGRFDRACVYFGDDNKLVYSYGAECSDRAFWSGSVPYLEHFNNDNMHVASNLFKVEGIDKEIFEKFRSQHTGCFVQAILGDKKNVSGYTSFECCLEGRRFTDGVINAVDYISKLIYEVLRRENR